MSLRVVPTTSRPMRTLAHVPDGPSEMAKTVDAITNLVGGERRELVMRVTALALGKQHTALEYLQKARGLFMVDPCFTDDEIIEGLEQW